MDYLLVLLSKIIESKVWSDFWNFCADMIINLGKYCEKHKFIGAIIYGFLAFLIILLFKFILIPLFLTIIKYVFGIIFGIIFAIILLAVILLDWIFSRIFE